MIELGKGVPGIKSGKLDATIKQSPAGGYSLGGGIIDRSRPSPADRGVTGKYEDGAFLVEADARLRAGPGRQGQARRHQPGHRRRRASRTGRPQPDGALIAYGGGSVTLTLTPWLQGTVGIQLKPNGEIEVTGEVALPPSFEVFPEKKVEKQVFSIGIDIPIIGVAVAGQRIGIFATIRGGLHVRAGFGPGQLAGRRPPGHLQPGPPRTTRCHGHRHVLRAGPAGLRLSVDGGLGAGIPVVSATAGLTVFGEVGVAGAASAARRSSWTPAPGSSSTPRASSSSSPSSSSASTPSSMSAPTCGHHIELYKRKWSLASFEYGSNLQFGLIFPLHYESGKPFELSFDQIQWTYPTIDPADLLGGLDEAARGLTPGGGAADDHHLTRPSPW